MSLETTDNIDLVKKPRLDNYFIWLLLAFLIGLTLRLLALNAMVYTQNELVLVNLALQISRRVGVVTSTVPIYTGLTSWLFYLFGPGNFLARLVPAIVGASIVLIPWLWKDQLGRKSSLILSFALALDPTFLLFSRAIHGGIFALAGLAWAITLLKHNKPWLAGTSLALAFLSGSAFWSFLFILGLTLLVLMLIKPEIVKDLLVLNLNSLKITWISFASGFAVSAFLIMTGFLLDPSGLGGSASGLIAFVSNFAQTFENPAYHMIYLLIAHSTLPLFVFFIGFFKFRSSETSDWYQMAGISIIISLLIGMLVSRESFEILLLPVLLSWIGGAIWLGKWQFRLTESRLSTALLMGFVLAILTYLSVNLRRLAQLTLGTPQFWNIFLMIIAGIILLVSAWWLVKFGWSNGTGTQVFLLAFLCFLAIASLSSSTRSLHSDQQVRSLEYLDNQLVLPNNDVEEILADFALTGKTLEQWGSFSLIDLPEELSWYFRDFNIARNQPGTSLVLSRTTSMPIQNDQFRGMNVVLERSINWRKGGITAYLQTASGKTSVFEDNKGVLWVRTFLFTGASQ
jgi:hypothetical protein